jgi:hypothetical protein
MRLGHEGEYIYRLEDIFMLKDHREDMESIKISRPK